MNCHRSAQPGTTGRQCFLPAHTSSLVASCLAFLVLATPIPAVASWDKQRDPDARMRAPAAVREGLRSDRPQAIEVGHFDIFSNTPRIRKMLGGFPQDASIYMYVWESPEWTQQRIDRRVARMSMPEAERNAIFVAVSENVAQTIFHQATANQRGVQIEKLSGLVANRLHLVVKNKGNALAWVQRRSRRSPAALTVILPKGGVTARFEFKPVPIEERPKEQEPLSWVDEDWWVPPKETPEWLKPYMGEKKLTEELLRETQGGPKRTRSRKGRKKQAPGRGR